LPSKKCGGKVALLSLNCLSDPTTRHNHKEVTMPTASTDGTDIPIVNMDRALHGGQADRNKERELMVFALEHFGLVWVEMDSDIGPIRNRWLEMILRYWRQPSEIKRWDARPEIGHQVGVMPPYTETARDNSFRFSGMPTENQPGRRENANPYWRFFHRFGERPTYDTGFPVLNTPPVIPVGFEADWATVTTEVGALILSAINLATSLISLEYTGKPETLLSMTRYGQHLLAPTGTNVSELIRFEGDQAVIAAAHEDLNWISGHLPANGPGLRAWTRDLSAFLVKAPPNCVLLQAGMQLQRVTGGRILAGLHEVLVTPALVRLAQAKELSSSEPFWRTSCTVFGALRSDVSLRCHPEISARLGLADGHQDEDILAGDFVLRELRAIGMLRD